MIKVWSDIAWDDYCKLFESHQQKLIKMVHELIKDIERNGFQGIGKSEPLKFRQGWSRRIDKENRLVFDIVDGKLYIASCRGHYED